MDAQAACASSVACLSQAKQQQFVLLVIEYPHSLSSGHSSKSSHRLRKKTPAFARDILTSAFLNDCMSLSSALVVEA